LITTSRSPGTAPAAAIAAAEWIVDGAPKLLDVSLFSQRRSLPAGVRLGDAVF
jgi:hypothetical protein